MRPLLLFSLPIVGLALLSLAVYPGCSSKQSDLRAMPFRGQPDLTLPGAEHAAGLAKADFNRDGCADFVYLSGSKLNVLLGERSTKFTSRRTISVEAGTSASGLAVGDFNEDGIPDIAVCHHDTNEVWVFLGKGDGTFRTPRKVSIPVTKPHCHAIVAADVNHDGHLDLALAQSDDNDVWVLLGDGKGNFAPSAGSPIPTGKHPYVVATGDFNRDGNLDVATPNWHSKSVSVLMGDGSGRFRTVPGNVASNLQNPTAIAVADLNGDGNPELVIGNNGTRGLQVFFGDGHGGFRAGPALNPAQPCFGPVVADLNGDGRLDIVATSTNGARTLSYWMNDGTGRFSAAQSLPCPDGANTICIADVNGDGVPDLVVGCWKDNHLLVWLGRRER